MRLPENTSPWRTPSAPPLHATAPQAAFTPPDTFARTHPSMPEAHLPPGATPTKGASEPPVRSVAEARRLLKHPGLAVDNPQLDAALQLLLDTTRPSEVHAILRALTRILPSEIAPGDAASIVGAMAVNRARHSGVRWEPFVAAVEQALKPPTRANDYKYCLEYLGEQPQADWMDLAEATRLLCSAHWTMDAVLNIMPEQRTDYTRANWSAYIDAARVLCETSGDATERSEMLRALSMVDAHAWGSMAGATQALSVGLQAGTSRLPVTRALAHMYAVNRPADRSTLLAPALRLCTQRMSAQDRATVIRALGAVLPKERADMVALCTPLRDTGVATAQFAAYINTLADTPSGSREHHRNRLLEQARMLAAGRPDAYHVDVENVAVYQRVEKAAASIEALRADGFGRGREAELASIERYLDSCMQDPVGVPATLFHNRGGASELQNARRTLRSPRRFGDYSECLAQNPSYHYGESVIGLGDLCASVWTSIRHHQAASGDAEEGSRERKNLRFSLVMALAQCIEDDGHRVCPVGVSQRLLQVLQGYHPGVHLDTLTPQALLCQVTQEFDVLGQTLDADAQPSHKMLADFVADAKRTATQHFEAASPDYETFVRELLGYLQLTYDWAP